jgi:hypothetical protein
MAIYAIIASEDAPTLEAAIEKQFPDQFYKVADGQFMLATDDTTNKVVEKLGTKGGKHGSILVLRVTNYNGWHNNDLWEWLATKSSRTSTPST